MISDPKVAQEVNALMLEFGRRLNDSVWLALENCPKEEFEDYRKAVGRVMGDMLLEIMNPLYRQHPDLKPKELD